MDSSSPSRSARSAFGQVIAGHRRLEAFRRLLADAEHQDEATAERFRTIPAHEKFDVTDEEMALFALVENLQRDDLSPLDAALGLSRFQEAHQLSTEALTRRTGLELRVKRLLRLARAPKVIHDACRQGVLIDDRDDRGTVRLLPSGNPKHQRSRLELMAALEFAKLHAYAMKSSPKKADERTARATQRALSERWSFRRVQAFCRGSIAAVEPEAVGVEAAALATPLPLFSDGQELLVRRSQLRSAEPEERAALLQLLTALVEELAS
jgi:ParB-like chromosome segregation protein Spo0J